MELSMRDRGFNMNSRWLRSSIRAAAVLSLPLTADTCLGLTGTFKIIEMSLCRQNFKKEAFIEVLLIWNTTEIHSPPPVHTTCAPRIGFIKYIH